MLKFVVEEWYCPIHNNKESDDGDDAELHITIHNVIVELVVVVVAVLIKKTTAIVLVFL
jgi:hypothetical protein